MKKLTWTANFRWGLFWVVVIGTGIVGEMIAVLNNGGGDTLSEQVWAIVDLGPAFWLAGLGAFSGGFMILLYHFFFQRGQRP